MAGVACEEVERVAGVAFAAVGVADDDADFGTAVAGVEVDEVDYADGLAGGCLDDEPHLPVGVDVAGGVGDVVVKHVAGVGHVGGADAPVCGVVLYGVEQVEVFGFYGSQVQALLCHFSISSAVTTVRVLLL